MGSGVNICAFLAGLAAFAGWTLSRLRVLPRVGWADLLGVAGIFALFFSIISPDDGGFQQELIRVAIPFVRVSAHTRVSPRQWPTNLSINAFAEAGGLIRVPTAGRSVVMDQPLEFQTHFHAPIPIHSPPVA